MEFDGQCRRLGGHGAEKAGIAASQEPQADYVQTWIRRYTAGMDDLLRRIEHWNVEPGIVALETGSPDDSSDAISSKV